MMNADMFEEKADKVLQLCRNQNIHLNNYYCAIITVCEYTCNFLKLLFKKYSAFASLQSSIKTTLHKYM